jgi:hypothetical protein
MIDPIADPPEFEMVKESHRELLREYGRDCSRWFTQIALWYLRPLRKRILQVTGECATMDDLVNEQERALIAYAKAVHETYNAVLQHDQKLNPLTESGIA